MKLVSERKDAFVEDWAHWSAPEKCLVHVVSEHKSWRLILYKGPRCIENLYGIRSAQDVSVQIGDYICEKGHIPYNGSNLLLFIETAILGVSSPFTIILFIIEAAWCSLLTMFAEKLCNWLELKLSYRGFSKYLIYCEQLDRSAFLHNSSECSYLKVVLSSPDI